MHTYSALPFALVVVVTGCAPDPKTTPALTIAADKDTAPADGLSTVDVTASLSSVPDGAVVTFQLSGMGLLSATAVAVAKGQAAVRLWAPFEDELGGDSFTSTVTATLSSAGVLYESSVDVTFTAPATGDPLLTVRTTPDRVVAGTTDAITLVIDGRRLTSDTVSLSADGDAVSLPATVQLVDGHAELIVPAPSSPAEVAVTLSSSGATAHAALHFIAPDAPQFDVSGEFASVAYGGMKIGNLIFLDPNPQCVVAPTFSLIHVTQTGSHIEMIPEVCALEMPGVSIVFGIHSTTSVGPGFISAINAQQGANLEIDLGEVAPGATYDLDASAFSAKVLGADLADPAGDALPTSGDDPRVTDADNDGHPGVTIHNSSQGDQYTVTRTTTLGLSGTIESSDVISGESTKKTESNIMNGGGLRPTITDLPVPFYSARVDGVNGAVNIAGRDGDPSSVSCADVVAYEDELMARFAAPDVSGYCN